MRRPRGRCTVCARPIALTPHGRLWTHGQPECLGSRRMPYGTHVRAPIWPAKHRGRPVTTIRGGIDTWTDTHRGAA